MRLGKPLTHKTGCLIQTYWPLPSVETYRFILVFDRTGPFSQRRDFVFLSFIPVFLKWFSSSIPSGDPCMLRGFISVMKLIFIYLCPGTILC